VIERSLLKAHPFVGQRQKKRQHCRLFFRRESDDGHELDLRAVKRHHPFMGISGSIVEFDDGRQVHLAAVVKIGRRQLDIPEARHFEGPIHDDRFRRWRGESLDAGQPIPKVILRAQTEILERLQHADVVETSVHRLAVTNAGWARPDLAHRGARQFGAFMAGDALATGLTAEQIDAQDRLWADRVGVAVHELVVGRMIGDEGRFIHLDGQAEEEREVVLHQRILVRCEHPCRRIDHDCCAVGLDPNQFGRIPPLAVKRRLDEFRIVAHAQAFLRPAA